MLRSSPWSSRRAAPVVALVALVVLAACGGGGGGGSQPPSGPRTLTVTVTGSGAGTVTSSPAGIACAPGNAGTCSASFAAGTAVTLAAAPGAGSTFGGWGGACGGTGACVVTVNVDMAVSAVIGLTRTLSITVAGSGGGTVTSSPAGISCGAGSSGACSAPFADGASVALNVSAASASWFDGWSGDCSGGGTCPLTMSANRSATATFTRTHTLSVTVAGTASGTVHSSPGGLAGGLHCSSGTCTAIFTEGTPVSLTTATSPGAALTAWSGDCTGAAACDLTMSADRAVTATFGPTWRLTVHVDGAGTGTVTSSPAGISCASGNVGTCDAAFAGGATVTLTAAPAAGSYVSAWAGATCAGTTCGFTVSADRTVTATIARKPVVTVALAGDGGGSVVSAPPGISCTTGSAAGCSAAFDPGTVVTLTPSPLGTASLVGWEQPCWNVRDACVFTATGDQTATAVFTAWEERTPFPRTLLAAAVLDGTMIAAGAGEAFVTSADGLQWTGHPEPRMAGTVRGLAVDAVAGRAVAAGDAGLLLWSDDAASWTPVTVTTAQLNAVARSPSAFVAVGSGATILSSSDGVTWTRRSVSLSAPYDLRGVAYGGGTWVATGVAGTVITSPDGQTWTDHTGDSGTTQTLLSVTYGASGFVAVGTSGCVISSGDGATWSVHAQVGTSALTSVASLGSLYVAVDGAKTAWAAGDPTGTWSASQLDPYGTDYATVAALGDHLFALSRSGAIVRAPTAGAATGWSLALAHVGDVLGLQIWDATYAASTYVVTGFDGAIFTSPDGITWTSRRANFQEHVSSVAYGNGHFVAVGSANLLVSADGLSWTQALPLTAYGGAVAYAAGKGFVVVTWATPSAILTSPDGTTWTTQTGTGITGSTRLDRLAYGASRFAAAGSPGVYTHADPASGGAWTPQSAPGGTFDGIAYGNGTFVLMLAGPSTSFWSYTSPDAVTWSSPNAVQPPATQQRLGFANGVFWTNGMWTSTDGVTWTAPDTLPLYRTANGGVLNASDFAYEVGVDAAAHGHAGWAGAKGHYFDFTVDGTTSFVRHP